MFYLIIFYSQRPITRVTVLGHQPGNLPVCLDAAGPFWMRPRGRAVFGPVRPGNMANNFSSEILLAMANDLAGGEVSPRVPLTSRGHSG